MSYWYFCIDADSSQRGIAIELERSTNSDKENIEDPMQQQIEEGKIQPVHPQRNVVARYYISFMASLASPAEESKDGKLNTRKKFTRLKLIGSEESKRRRIYGIMLCW